MPTSVIALEILLILLPGFAAAYVVQVLASRAAQTDLDKVIEACLYSFLIYSVFVVFAHGALPFDVVAAKPPSTEATILWHGRRVAGLAGITLLSSLLGALYIHHDGNWLFRRLKLTERTTRRSIWNDIFQKEAKFNQVVQVELADGRSILGVLTYYSDTAEECSVFVANARWIGKTGDVTLIPGAGILLTRNSNIQSISLLEN